MNEQEVAQQAQSTFDGYAAMDAPELPTNNMSALQVRLARWQVRNFGCPSLVEQSLGACEEVGELAHVVLKRAQKIRGYGDPAKVRADGGDAIADAVIYLMQVATELRMDFGTLLVLTAERVMERDWVQDSAHGGEAA